MQQSPTPPPQDDTATSRPPTVKLDDDGDLLLRVGADGKQREFRVCSRTMARTSPVWKTMLFGGFKESKPDQGEWVVTLPEDDPSLMLVVLRIAHGKTRDVPIGKTNLSGLHDILVIANKYDCADSLRPWLALWKPTSLRSDLLGEDLKQCLELLGVAWELGDEREFSYAIELLVKGCLLNTTPSLPDQAPDLLSWKATEPPASNSAVPSDTAVVFGPLCPDSIEDFIRDQQSLLASTIWQPFLDALDKIDGASGDRDVAACFASATDIGSNADVSRKMCDTYQYGLIMRRLRELEYPFRYPLAALQLSLHPQPRPGGRTKESVADVVESISDIGHPESRKLSDGRSTVKTAFSRDHIDCDPLPAIQSASWDIYELFEVTHDDRWGGYQERMEQQRAKWGPLYTSVKVFSLRAC